MTASMTGVATSVSNGHISKSCPSMILQSDPAEIDRIAPTSTTQSRHRNHREELLARQARAQPQHLAHR